MAGELTVEPNQQNFRPKIRLQPMLGLHDGEVITGRDHASVQGNKVILARLQDDLLLSTRRKGQGTEGEK
jgi:hypothetical protein